MAFRRSGPLRAFRIADMRHTIFDGSGAMLHGARWNSPGRRVLYAAETASFEASRSFGDRWYDERRTPVLMVPSVVTHVERNILINQEHPDFSRISASQPVPVSWDRRLWRRP
jgi:RES domain-containing protein